MTENIDNVNTFMFVAAFQHGGTTIFASYALIAKCDIV